MAQKKSWQSLAPQPVTSEQPSRRSTDVEEDRWQVAAGHDRTTHQLSAPLSLSNSLSRIRSISHVLDDLLYLAD